MGETVQMDGENNIIGNYRVLRELTTSSFSRVYVAQHNVLTSRTVAIKLMLSAPLDSSEKRENFLQEARFLEMLKHPYILPIYDVSIHNGIPYLVTEYAQYGSLRQRLKQQYPALLTLEESLSILSQIGQALEFAHRQHIIHRDLKPENILFNAKGDALLMDFGIATTLDTASIKMVDNSGTPTYMAPEQFRGKVSKESDQYALGCIAYELFTGHAPFTASDYFALGFKHITESPPSPTAYNPQLPTNMEQAILKALAKERTGRYPDIQTFIHALQTSFFAQQSLPTLPAMPTRTDLAALSHVQEKAFSHDDFSLAAEQGYPPVAGHVVREQESDYEVAAPPRAVTPVPPVASQYGTTPVPPAAPLYAVEALPSVYQKETLITPQGTGRTGEEISTGDSSQSEAVWSSWKNNSAPASSVFPAISETPASPGSVAQPNDNALPFAPQFRQGFKGRKGILIALTCVVLLIVLVGVLFFEASTSFSMKTALNNPTATTGTSTLTFAPTATTVPQSTATHGPGAHATPAAHATPGTTPQPTPGTTSTAGVHSTPGTTPTSTPHKTPTPAPTSAPTVTPTPTPTPKPSETLSVSFTDPAPGQYTTYSYSGTVTITVSGYGQASSTQYSDAFYRYTDTSGNPLAEPGHPVCWVMNIDGEATDNFVATPSYSSSHVYTFTMTAPGGQLSFDVCDNDRSDNTGSYSVTVTQD